MSSVAKIFDILAIGLSVLYNLNSPTKLFLDLYLVKFLAKFLDFSKILSMHYLLKSQVLYYN